jgi:RNA polymerase sigma-70 factor (ECF subfamily)
MRDGRAWFKTVVRNLFIDSRRSVARRRGLSLDRPVPGSGESLAESLSSSGLDAEGLYERDEERRAVRRVIGRLGRRHREVLKLCDLQELSYQEAAEALALPPGTLRSRLHRARRSFRTLWIKEQQLTHA